MKYITLDDLNKTIRTNLHKIPRDIDFVIGIPRSGMIVASIVAEYLNLPLIDIDSFLVGAKPTGGNRLKMVKIKLTNRVLVLDDTVYSGASMKDAKNKLKDYGFDFVCGCAYLEGPGMKEVDFYLEDVRKYTRQFPNVLYQWNFLHHWPLIAQRSMYDIDGVFCLEPPDERNTEEYEKYIANAIPLYVPTVPIGKIVTYRLIKYKDITKKWLQEQGINYGQLIMFNAQSWEERNQSGISPEALKAYAYKMDANMFLFIESDDRQAKAIYEYTQKPVLCTDTNIMYGNEV